MKKFILPVFLLISVFVFSNCEVGMGTALDLEAPEITITSPVPPEGEELIYVGLDFTITGTCKDNIAVTSVVVYYKGRELGKAVVTGNDWYFQVRGLTKEDEGQQTFECVVNDAAGNSSVRSKKSILVRIDETAPDDKSWYIERCNGSGQGNGIQTPLKTLEELKQINTGLSKNKDIPQNQEFVVHGSFYDAMSISEIILVLRREDGSELLRKVVDAKSVSEAKTDTTSMYTPLFRFTHDEIVNADSSFATGKHYVQFAYFSKDERGNSSEKVLSWMMWYPESDVPGIYQGFVMNNKITVSVKSSIPVDFYDDDGLTEYRLELLLDSTYKTITGNDSIEQVKQKLISDESYRDNFFSVSLNFKESRKVENSLTGGRDYFNDVTAPESPNQMFLVACARDVNGRWASCIYETLITDESIPLMYIEKPVENAVPDFISGTTEFTIEGYALDTKGCSSVKIMYIPDSSDPAEAEKKAIEIFEQDKTASGNTKKYSDGFYLASGTLVDAGKESEWNKQSFSFTFDLFDTDCFAESQRKELKLFELQVVDTDGNAIYKQFKVAGDTAKPLMVVKFNKDEPIVKTDPVIDMFACDYSTEDLLIKFMAYKDNSLKIETSKYKLTDETNGNEYTVGNGLIYDSTDGSVSLKINRSVLESYAMNPRLKFKFYAEDALGNYFEDKRTVLLTSKPILKNISTDWDTSVVAKIGDALKIKAVFSNPVKLSGAPKLKVTYGGKEYWTETAEPYKPTGSGTDTIIFTFIVPEDIDTEQVKIAANGSDSSGKVDQMDGLHPIYLETENDKIEISSSTITGDANIKLNSADEIYLNLTSGTNAQKVKIDGTRPFAKLITVKGRSGNDNSAKTRLMNGDIVEASVEISDKVMVSGSPNALLKADGKNLTLTYIKTSNKNIVFECTVGKEGAIVDEIDSLIVQNISTVFSASDLSFITDEAGNSIKMVTGSDENTSIVIDTKKPAKPEIKIACAGEEVSKENSYHKTPTITVTNFESDSEKQYSLDGGASWKNYTAPFKLSDGTHYVAIKQKDKAGNVSDVFGTWVVEVHAQFPDVQGLILKASDNQYFKKGDKVTFEMSFSYNVNAVKGSSKENDSVYLKITNTAGDVSDYVRLKESVVDKTVLVFEYEVGDKVFDGVRISDVAYSTLRSMYEEAPTYDTDTRIAELKDDIANGKRDLVHFDGRAPVLASSGALNPANNAISSIANTKGTFKITVKFAEPVEKETGTIILQRKGDWAIPIVLDNAVFESWYNKVDSDKKETLKLTENGMEKFHGRTGIALGPYRKITHGLLKNGSTITGVPDEATKYVLAYEVDCYNRYEKDANGKDTSTEIPCVIKNYKIGTDGKASDGKGSNGDAANVSVKVSDIRKAWESAGYHQHYVDVQSDFVKVSGTNNDTVTIEFDEDIEPGREWQLFIPDTAFRDKAGNFYKGMNLDLPLEGTPREDDVNSTLTAAEKASSDKYSFWSKGIAEPIVRVERYTHGYGAIEPNPTFSNGKVSSVSFTEIDVNNGKYSKNIKGAASTPPTGWARARIDCETPGATITYKVVNAGESAKDEGTDKTQFTGTTNDFNSYRSNIPDATSTQLTLTSGGTAYIQRDATHDHKDKDDIYVGESFASNESDWKARKDYIVALASGNNATANGYEGVFRTVVCVDSQSNERAINIEGGTAPGGQPNVSGFPLRDATDEDYSYTKGRYSKNAFCYGNSPNQRQKVVFVSYEIISKNWGVLVCRSNHAKDYPLNNYGDMVYITTITDHDGKN